MVTSPTAGPLVLRAAELVELSERVYRSIFRAGLWVALGTAGYGLSLVLVQVGPIDRLLAGAVCVALAGALLQAARHHARVYTVLHHSPGWAVPAALALAAGYLTIGSGSEVLLPLTLIVLGVLASAVSIRWILLCGLLVGAAQAAPMLLDDLTAAASRALITAAAADVFAPLLFAALLERLARFTLELGRAPETPPSVPVPPLRVRATMHRSDLPPDAERTDEPPAPAPLNKNLTVRQRQALLLVSSGESYATVAACLGVSEGQVTKLLAQARQRVGVITTQQLVAWAVASGAIPPP